MKNFKPIRVLNKGRGPQGRAQYGAYVRGTDELVAMGTAREVAEVCDITVESLYCFVSRGTGKYEYVRLEDGEV